jgi:hypothetical protein
MDWTRKTSIEERTAPMELVLALGALCALGLLAARWGVDSRETLHSKEQELAALGLTWSLR